MKKFLLSLVALLGMVGYVMADSPEILDEDGNPIPGLTHVDETDDIENEEYTIQ